MDYMQESYSPSKKQGHFYKTILIKQLIAYFQTLQKIHKYYFVALKVTKWFTKFKMAILK
jgi:hypothetical protein